VPLVTFECENCHKTIEKYVWPSQTRRFCSRECADEAKLGQHKPGVMVEKNCLVCGKPFSRERKKGRRQVYCSMACAGVGKRRTPAPSPATSIQSQTLRKVKQPNQVMYQHARERSETGRQVTGWVPNSRPLCAGGHNSVEVAREGIMSLFECRLCHATRWLSNAGPWQDTWGTARKGESVESVP
jgi:endogenous inhibitor of DNA gyrase (YacG/DUF329 family)